MVIILKVSLLNSKKMQSSGRRVRKKVAAADLKKRSKLTGGSIQMKWDEDIHSSSDEDNTTKDEYHSESDNDINESADQKRTRIAREYLKEVQGDIDDKEDSTDADMQSYEYGAISDTLRRDRLSSQHKLFRNFTESIKAIDPCGISSSRYSGHDQAITSVSLSSDNLFVISGSKDNSVIRWDTESGTKTFLMSRWKRGNESQTNAQQGEVLATAVSTDGKYCATGGRDRKVRIFDLRTNQEIKAFEGHRDAVTSLSFRPDSNSLFSGSLDRCVKHWDLNEMGYLETLFGHQEGIYSLDCWHKGRPVSSSGDRKLRLWNTANDTHLVFRGHKGAVDTVQMLTDNLVLSGSQDGTVSLWKETQKKSVASVAAAHGTEPGSLNNRWICSLCAMRMSDIALSGSYDGYLRFWSIKNITGKCTMENDLSVPTPGFINSISVSDQMIALGTGREHKFGRWWCEKGNKNKVYILKVPLIDNSATQEKNSLLERG